MKKIIKYLKVLKWGRIFILFSGIFLIIALIAVDAILDNLSTRFKTIVEMPKLFYYVVGITMFIAIIHLMMVPKGGIAKEHLLYKRLGPILAVPLTCVTNGIFFYCGLLIIYIICYDNETLRKYTSLDRTTVTITMLTLMTYAIYSLGLIISDICNPKEEKMGLVNEINENIKQDENEV